MNLSIDIEKPTPAVRDNSRIVAPPPQLKRFEARAGENPATWVDYGKHPAYAMLTSTLTLGQRIAALARFTKYFCLIAFKRIVSYELIPAHLRRFDTLGAIGRFAKAALCNAVQKLVVGSGRYRADQGTEIEKELRTNGICVLKTDDMAFNRVQQAASPLLQDLRKLRGDRARGGREFAESRGSALRTRDAQLFTAVENLLAQSGVLDACSAYIGQPAMLIDVNPQINDASDDFWQRIFPDLPESPRPTAYMHRDASGGDIKAIFYMSDVGAGNGPFSYSIGSQRTERRWLTDWIEETNDQSGASGTSAEDRRSFIALPGALRRKCAFGNDVLPDTEIERRARDAEWTIQAGRGHLVVFDTKGFHRGGMVREGDRIVLTCVIGSPRR